MKKQRKKLLCLGLAVMLLVSPMTEQNTQAQEVTEVQEVVESPAAEDIVPSTGYKTSGDWRYTELSDGTVEISRYYGTSEKLVIPQKIKGKNVTSIGEYAFWGCNSLTSVQIPSGVKTIGYDAFSYCSNLTSVQLPDTMTLIGVYAFVDCNKLKSINIPPKVTRITMGTFAYCSSLTTIYLPNKVKNIDMYAFVGCSDLKRIYIPDSVTKIDDKVFDDCKNLTIYCGYNRTVFAYAKDNSLACKYGEYVAPDQVMSCKVKFKSANSVTVSWEKSSKVNGYEVYRATSANGHYTRCKVLTSGSKTSYVDKKLKGGKTYYYKVRAYSTYGSYKLYSPYSKVVEKHIKGSLSKPKLEKPKTFSAGKPMILKWNKIKNADKIVVYCSKNNNRYKEVKTVAGNKTKTGLVMDKYVLKKGNVYRFRIRAYYKTDGVTVYSPYSNSWAIGRK